MRTDSTTEINKGKETVVTECSAYVERVCSFASGVFMDMALLEYHDPNLGGISHEETWLRLSSRGHNCSRNE